MAYPEWFYFPSPSRPPDWVHPMVAAVAEHQNEIDSRKVDGLNSDRVLAYLRPSLEAIGFEVEQGKKAAQKIRRPVLFGAEGKERVSYEVDGVHDELGIVLEVEAGRGVLGNAIYRDLIRTSLIVDARFLVMGVMLEYRYKSGGRPVKAAYYDTTRDLLDAVYASGRLGLPFEGVLLFGY